MLKGIPIRQKVLRRGSSCFFILSMSTTLLMVMMVGIVCVCVCVCVWVSSNGDSGDDLANITTLSLLIFSYKQNLIKYYFIKTPLPYNQ